ncbi:MAG TPA: hypothetical protein PKY25_00835 [Bacilli bacterium]|nr:hypothetical protein [Bacilli bacterium]
MIKDLKIYKSIKDFKNIKKVKLISSALALTMLICVAGCCNDKVKIVEETTIISQDEQSIAHFLTNEHIFSEKIEVMHAIIYAHGKDIIKYDSSLFERTSAIPEYYEIFKVEYYNQFAGSNYMIVTYRNTEPVFVVGKYDSYAGEMTYNDFGQQEKVISKETTTVYQKTKN